MCLGQKRQRTGALQKLSPTPKAPFGRLELRWQSRRPARKLANLMPFPLAHPAAVLPMRRYCPRFLSFPALIIGSLCPDAGYAFGKWGLGQFSHEVLGSIGFCLPIGFVCLWVLYRFRARVVAALPDPYRQEFLPLCQRPPGSVAVLAMSIILGAWTHLLLDSLTHKHGWLVEQFVFLKSPAGSIWHRHLRVYHLLWYGCTFGGVLWLGLAYLKWLSGAGGRPLSVGRRLAYAMSLALLVMPLAVAHHLVHHPLELGVVSLAMLLMAGSFVLLAGR